MFSTKTSRCFDNGIHNVTNANDLDDFLRVSFIFLNEILSTVKTHIVRCCNFSFYFA